MRWGVVVRWKDASDEVGRTAMRWGYGDEVGGWWS